MVRAWDTQTGRLEYGPQTAHTDAIEAMEFLVFASASREQGIPGCITGGLDSLLRVTAIEKNELVGRGTTRRRIIR